MLPPSVTSEVGLLRLDRTRRPGLDARRHHMVQIRSAGVDLLVVSEREREAAVLLVGRVYGDAQRAHTAAGQGAEELLG